MSSSSFTDVENSLMTPSPNRRVLLEVAVASVEDALAAQEGGADRLELNAALALGGLTPSLGTLIEVKAAVALPALVMIRPRPGGFARFATQPATNPPWGGRTGPTTGKAPRGAVRSAPA